MKEGDMTDVRGCKEFFGMRRTYACMWYMFCCDGQDFRYPSQEKRRMLQLKSIQNEAY